MKAVEIEEAVSQRVSELRQRLFVGHRFEHIGKGLEHQAGRNAAMPVKPESMF